MRLALAIGALVAFLSVPYAVRRPLLASGSPLALGLIGGVSLIGVAASVVAILGVAVAPEPLPMAALGEAIEACIAGVARLLAHPLNHWPSIFAAAVLAALVARLGVVAVRTAVDARRGRPPNQRLPSEDDLCLELIGARVESVRLLNSDVPLAYTAGWLRPQAVVSTGLLRALERPQRLAVIAHERSHATRRHVTLLFVASVLKRAYAFIPGIRLAAEYLALSLEMGADDDAVRAVGDPIVVATAIASSARATAATQGFRFGITGGDVAKRVARLTNEPPRRWPGRAIAVAMVGVAALAMLMVAWSSASAALTRERVALAQHATCHLPHRGSNAA